MVGAELLSRFSESRAQVTDTFAKISGNYWAGSDKGWLYELFSRAGCRVFAARLFSAFQPGYGLGKRPRLKYWRNFCRSSALNPGALETLQQLSRRYRLGVITNGFIDSQRGRLEAAGLTPYFDPILISEEVGVAKPDARIFEMALDALGLSAADVIYVGDSIGHDCAGCISAGIDFCHYCPHPAMDLDLPAVKFRIGRLFDLADLLC